MKGVVTPPDTERERRTAPANLRLVRRSSGALPRIRGSAAVFNSLSEDLGSFREVIRPGAFKEALRTSDVRCLFNHAPDHVLGRVPRTLRLWETDRALEFECDVPDTSIGRDVLALVERKDITGNSFSFVVDKDEWHEAEDGTARRTILKVRELFDIGPVTYPAYPDTVVSARAVSQARHHAERTAQHHAERTSEDLHTLMLLTAQRARNLSPQDAERIAKFERMRRWGR